MTRCTNRRTAILTLILGLTLLLCGCQVGGGVFVLPDISTKDSTQGKARLLAALNQEIRDGTRSFITTLPPRLFSYIFKTPVTAMLLRYLHFLQRTKTRVL